MDHRSPLDNIFNIISALPQGHDKPVKHAVYNAAAIFLLTLCCGAAYALYMILDPFIKPLIWALLVGSVLHPIKHRLSHNLKSWFYSLDRSGTPVILGMIVAPISLVNNFSEFIGSQLLARYKIIICVIVILPLAHVIYYYTPWVILRFIWISAVLINDIILYVISCISLPVMCLCATAYLSALILFWKPENKIAFHRGALGVWLVFSCFIANQVQAFQMAVFAVLLVLFLIGCLIEIYQLKDESSFKGTSVTILESIKLIINGEKPLHQCSDKDSNSDEGSEIGSLLEPTHDPSEKENIETVGDWKSVKETYSDTKIIEPNGDSKICPVSPDLFENERKRNIKKSNIPINNTGLLITDKGKIHVIQPASSTEIFSSANIPKVKRSLSQPYVTGQSQYKSMSGLFNLKKKCELPGMFGRYKKVIHSSDCASYYYMYALAWACGIMIFWKHMRLLPILPIPILIYIVKHVGLYLGIWNWQYIIDLVKNKVTYDERFNALVPIPIRGMFNIIMRVDTIIKNNFKGCIDTVASSVVIFGLIVFVTCASIFILVQVYAEAIMLVQMTSNVINQTVVHNPELRQLLPPTFDDTLDSILDNAYQYGREGISKGVRRMLSEVDPSKSEKLERQVLELWDRVYQSWMTSETSTGPKVTPQAVQTSWEAFIADIQKSPEIFNINGVVDFGKQNLGMLMSLLESVWMILKGNITLVIGSFSTIISIVLGGSTAVLNFILNMIIFLTTLFYLLSSSGHLYKPVEMMTNLSTSGSRFGLALEDAVNGVFTASFKMAVFYGMWTWFIHNLFGLKIVYLPSAFASILGASPFLGTYWACIPAVLDLWLAQDQGFLAILFFIFQFMPTSVVDTAIYAEIKGGGHPYLTGLAIAGGIFCLGLEGAIIGPLVLCGLYVVMDLSTAIFKESPSEETINIQQLSRLGLHDV